MALNPLEAFTLDAAAGTSFGSSSSAVALPGTPASDLTVRIAVLGPCHCAFKLGTANTVTVTPATGVVVLAGQTLVLALAGNTYLAGVSCGGTSTASTVNIATGS